MPIAASTSIPFQVTELVFTLLMARLIVGNMYEIGLPAMKVLWKRIRGKHRSSTFDEPRWQSDYKLEEAELDGVSEEYMEMMVSWLL